MKLLESNSIPALMGYPPNSSGAGITIDKDTSNPGAIPIDDTVLSASVTQMAWMSEGAFFGETNAESFSEACRDSEKLSVQRLWISVKKF